MTQEKHLLSLLNLQITQNQPNKNDISRAQNAPNLLAGWPDYARNSGLWDPMSLRFGSPRLPFSYKISRQNPRGPFPKPFFFGEIGKALNPSIFLWAFWGPKVEILRGWASEIPNIAIGKSPNFQHTSSFMVDFSASHVSFRGGGEVLSTMGTYFSFISRGCFSSIFSRLKTSIFPWVFWGPKVEILGGWAST